MYRKIGAGWTFTLLSGVTLLTAPLLLLVIRNGGTWKRKREERFAIVAIAQDKAIADGKARIETSAER